LKSTQFVFKEGNGGNEVYRQVHYKLPYKKFVPLKLRYCSELVI